MNDYQEQFDSSLVSIFKKQNVISSSPSNFEEFKADFLPIYHNNCNNLIFEDAIEAKVAFFECLQELYQEEQPPHILEYLSKIAKTIKPKLRFHHDEVIFLYQKYRDACYKDVMRLMDKKYSKYFNKSNYYQQNPLIFFFQIYYSKYGDSHKYLIFLKKYLLAKKFLTNDIPYDTFVNLFATFIDTKKQVLKGYYDLLSEILVQFINPNEIWPTVPTLSAFDIKAIRKLTDKRLSENSTELETIIKNGELDATVTFKEFREEINLIINELCQEKFNNSFLNLYPEEFKNSYGQITKKGCLTLYISIFQENYSYIMNLINFLGEFAIDFNFNSEEVINEIVTELNELREEIAITSHMNNLEQSLSKNVCILNQCYTIEDIDELDGLDFELFLQKLFSKMGYTAEVTKSTGDQGADLILFKLGRKIAIQAKRYNTKLDNTPIQEILGAKAYYGCNETMVVTNSYFTKKAIELAHVNQVQLIDRDDLIELLEAHPIYKDH